MRKSPKFSPEVVERSVRMVFDAKDQYPSQWAAIESSAGEVVDWFPDDVPVLLAQLDGGEGRLSDAGLKLESDRLLVRVVGWGGKP